MTVKLPAIALIGTGKMGGAILEGMLQPGVEATSVRATTQTEAAAVLLRDRGVEARSIEADSTANEWAARDADIVILAVKPHYILDVAAGLAHALGPDAVVVSVAAGMTTDQIEQAVSHPVIRAMPNTPSQIRQGVTGLAAGSRASAEQLAAVSGLFGLVGDVVVVDEAQINHLSALSGSGGAAALLDSSGETPSELRRAVTSPGGTTEQAIAVLDEHDLGAIWSEAVDRAVARAREMAEGG